MKYQKIILKTFILISASFIFFVLPYTTNALTVSPPRLELRGDPGATVEGLITLTNEKNTPEQFFLSFANFEAQGETGNPAFVEPQNGLGSWITAPSAVSFLPQESKIVPFSITIPQNAEPGGHFAAVFWGTGDTSSGGQISIGAKVGTLILLSVSGDVKEEAGLLNFNTSNNKFWYNSLPVSFEYRFKNDGGDRVKPAGHIKIRNTFFLPRTTLNANESEGNVLPNSTRKYTVKWLEYGRDVDYQAPAGIFSKYWSQVEYQWKNFALGLYSGNLMIEYGTAGEITKKTVFFFVFPWQLVLIIAIILFILLWGGRKVLKHYNRYIIEKARVGINPSPEHSNNG